MNTKLGLALALYVPAAFAQQSAAPLAATTSPYKESSMEVRMQLDLEVPDEVIKSYLPDGFTASVASQGPAKDCNVRLIFADRVTVNGQDGKPIGKGNSRVIFFAAPVKDAAGNAAQLILGGLVDDETNAPGPFGNYILATTHEMKRTSSTTETGTLLDTQDWNFKATTGEHLEMHMSYERSANNRSGRAQDLKSYSAKVPSYVETSHQEQVLEILRNTTTNPPDKVKSFSLKIGGGSFAKFAPGAEKPLSWDNVVWMNRQISIP